MLISDHINLSWRNPLIGPVVPGDERFPDMSQPYDETLRRQLHDAATRIGMTLQEGVYGGLLGPTYETPAEVRMLERLGVDAVGMSTVPEVIVARAIGMRCCAISCITNQAAGISQRRVAHEDVLAVTAVAASAFERLVIEFVRGLDA
jgi:purine-nucleoside phosphorylase